jgi:hypothetical protein
MTKPAIPATTQKPLLRLVRHILGADGGIVPETGGDGTVRLGRSVHALATLQQALSLGLIRHAGQTLCATPEARGFVKRTMLAQAYDNPAGQVKAVPPDPDPQISAFAGQHQELVAATVDLEGRRHPVSRNLNESPLSGLSRLKDKAGTAFFPAEALEAGERLLADFTRGQLQPRITSSWEPRLSARSKGEAGGMADIAASAIEARRRFGRAMQAMGPELSGVAADICCFGKGLELVERERQWPARSAKLMLRTALMALARHYAPPTAQRPGRHSHHWATEDFRPSTEAYGSSAR